MGEGMRQAVKDYERHVAGYLKNRGLDAAKTLPPRLKNGLDVFRKVQNGLLDGSCTVEQAQEMLKSLGRAGRSKMPVTPADDRGRSGALRGIHQQWGCAGGAKATGAPKRELEVHYHCGYLPGTGASSFPAVFVARTTPFQDRSLTKFSSR